MEFPDLGQHCSMPSCNQLDFLPFECGACHQIFCLEHRSFKAHNCGTAQENNRVVPECPLCGELILVQAGEDVNTKVDAHISAGCPPTGVGKESQKPKRSNPCSAHGCRGGELVPIICPYCKKNFCTGHRAPHEHRCPYDPNAPIEVKAVSKEKMEKQKGVLDRIEGFLQLRLSNKTSDKVKMMRMRQKAIGNEKIPLEKRYYLEVVFPMDSRVEPKLMFFDSAWSVGKVLDVVASSGSVENFNNKPNGPYKLYLFSLKTGAILPFSSSLSEIEPNVLSSGDCVLLEMVANKKKSL